MVLKQYFMMREYQQVFFHDRYDVSADLVFQSHNMPLASLSCRMSPRKNRIVIQESPLSYLQLPVCFSESGKICRRIGIESLLVEVERVMTSPRSENLLRNCPRCSLTLSVRERQILQAITCELVPEQIAKVLKLSIKTISSHKRRAMEKLGFTHSNELYYWLRRGGLTHMSKINSN